MEQEAQSALYILDKEIAQLDVQGLTRARVVTDKLSRTIENAFHDIKLCPVGRLALFLALKNPLYASATNNHFTREFDSDNFSIYRERLINEVKDEYISMMGVIRRNAESSVGCGNTDPSDIDGIESKLESIVDIWVQGIAREVIIICEHKLSYYEKFKDVFTTMKDEFRLDIVNRCIEKNTAYIANCKKRLG